MISQCNLIAVIKGSPKHNVQQSYQWNACYSAQAKGQGPSLESAWFVCLFVSSMLQTTGNFTAAISSDCESTTLEDPSPERRFQYPTFCHQIFFALDNGQLRSNKLSIHLLNYQDKILQKSLLHYSGSYLPTTPLPSVIFVTKQIPGGGTFYCSIARYPKLPNCLRARNSMKLQTEKLFALLQILQLKKKTSNPNPKLLFIHGVLYHNKVLSQGAVLV